MTALTLSFASLALVLSVITFMRQAHSARRLREGRLRPRSNDEELLHVAWLEELEARGQELLQQFAEAERRLLRSDTSSEHAETERRPDSPADEEVGSDPLPADPLPVAVGVNRAPDASLDFRRAVAQLAAQGLDAAAIARELQAGTGEVELVLELTTRKFPES